ncbi:MAG: DmsC/YnfH family molybdoenzyme membrane anchor subunit [Pseudomonadota bacterium]
MTRPVGNAKYEIRKLNVFQYAASTELSNTIAYAPKPQAGEPTAMKPAFSVVFLTTLIGAGQGLFLTQFGAQTIALLGLVNTASQSDEFIVGGVISLLLLIAGLAASFFHLGHPERAWRAAAMWRTSWLSREVIALPLAMGAIFVSTAVHYLSPNAVLTTLASGRDMPMHFGFSALAVVATILLFICTSMIYACLKFLRQWHSPLTVLNFFLMGCASGALLAAALGTTLASPHMTYYTKAKLL